MPAEFTKTVTVRPATALEGVVRVPGDKSISHRYAMLAALADGVTRISHYAPGNDCQSTLKCLEQLGTIVYLALPTDALEARAGSLAARGVVREPGQDLDALHRERAPLYQRWAQHTVDALTVAHRRRPAA